MASLVSTMEGVNRAIISPGFVTSRLKTMGPMVTLHQQVTRQTFCQSLAKRILIVKA